MCYVVHHLALEVLHVLFGFCWRVLRSSSFVEGQQTIVFKKAGARVSSGYARGRLRTSARASSDARARDRGAPARARRA